MHTHLHATHSCNDVCIVFSCSHKNRVINEPRSHSIPDVKETLKNGTFLQDISNSQRKTPYINVAGMDFDAFDNYSDDDDDGYVNDDEKKAAVSSIKTHQN